MGPGLGTELNAQSGQCRGPAVRALNVRSVCAVCNRFAPVAVATAARVAAFTTRNRRPAGHAGICAHAFSARIVGLAAQCRRCTGDGLAQ